MTAKLVLLSLLVCLHAHAAAAAEDPRTPYTAAFRALVAGEWGLAYDGLGEVRAAYPSTEYAARARQHMLRLDDLGLGHARRRVLDQSGRAETIGFGVLYGAWAGLATTVIADADDDEKTLTVGMMLGAPAALLSAAALTRGRTLTRGRASLIRLGGYFGTWQGVGLALLGDGRRSTNTQVASALAGGLVGIGAASLAGAATDPTRGEAALMNYGAIWGTWLSFAATQAMGFDDGVLGSTLAGGAAGLATMAAVAPRTDVREGRANLINLGGLAGTAMAGGVLLITQPASSRAAMAVLMAGGIGGLVVAANATKGYGSAPARRVRGGRP